MLDRFLEARRADDLVVLEGFEALSHALRFAEEILEVATADPEALARRLPLDLRGRLEPIVTREGLPEGDILIVAKRPPFAPQPGTTIHLAGATATDLGRAIRVAAAAGVTTVLTDQDPWSQDALEASQGLHFALAVGRVDGPPGEDVTLAFGPGAEVTTRAGTTLDLASALAAVLWSR